MHVAVVFLFQKNLKDKKKKKKKNKHKNKERNNEKLSRSGEEFLLLRCKYPSRVV